MKTFSLLNRTVNIILVVHTENIDAYLSRYNSSFRKEWEKFIKNEYEVNADIRNHLTNLVATYGQSVIQEWLDARVRKTA